MKRGKNITRVNFSSRNFSVQCKFFLHRCKVKTKIFIWSFSILYRKHLSPEYVFIFIFYVKTVLVYMLIYFFYAIITKITGGCLKYIQYFFSCQVIKLFCNVVLGIGITILYTNIVVKKSEIELFMSKF